MINIMQNESSSPPIPIVILGGWSPGPLNHLKRFIRRHEQQRLQHGDDDSIAVAPSKHTQTQFIILEPSIPMPPMVGSWCCDVAMIALIATLLILSWACYAVSTILPSRGWTVLARLVLFFFTVLLPLRWCVAWIVRRSIAKGVRTAQRLLDQYERIGDGASNNAIVIGFSWGGGVAAELLLREQRQRSLSALLIAPTTALIASISMQKDAALRILEREYSDFSPSDSNQVVHVFHASHDQAFCPHANRWESTAPSSQNGGSVSLHWCRPENHVFLQPSSIQALQGTLLKLLLQRHQQQV